MTRSLALALALTPCLLSTGLAQSDEPGSSFADVWRTVAETRPYHEDEPLPARKPLPRAFPHSLIPDEIRAVFLVRAKDYATSDSNLIVRSRTTLDPATTGDVRTVNRANPKPLHPLGIAFSARWEIRDDSPFTGLFAPGARLPYAIVRVSSGTRDAKSLDERILGMAIKLFPTQDPAQPVLTRNILTLDQFGFDANVRARPFHSDAGEPIYYTNFAPPKDPNAFLPRNLNRFFNHFDAPNEHRPVEALAEVDAEGQPVRGPACAPFEVVFRPLFEPRFRLQAIEDAYGPIHGPLFWQVHGPHRDSFRDSPKLARDFAQGVLYRTVPYDFRDLIRAYDPADALAFEICYVEWGPEGRGETKPLGTLTITSRAVVSDGGDLDLHFHHLSHPEQPDPAAGKAGLAERLEALQKQGGCPMGH
ncbi:MAG: hypothetical protein KDD82_03970 [Planctomycetes bacterium]|nr:hypothetical protein [Planctomycetota bacterium]